MVGGWSKVIGISLVICHPGTMENFNIENSDNRLLHIELCAWRMYKARHKYFFDGSKYLFGKIVINSTLNNGVRLCKISLYFVLLCKI
jgi:hypothetical protein